MENLIEIQIPFAGFYYSIHSDQIDSELEDMPDYWANSMPCDMPGWLVDMFFDAADWSAAHDFYAKEYAESFCAEYLDDVGEFSAMTSPREYNFETDRIFVKVTRAAIARLWRGADRGTLTRIAGDRHTSRDGFASFYSPEWQTWGRLSEWDHNQLMTLLLAYLETERGEEWDQWAEYALVEDLGCNDGIHNAMWSSEKASRPWKLWNYLTYDRPNRTIKTMAQWRKANQQPWETTPLGGAA